MMSNPTTREHELNFTVTYARRLHERHARLFDRMHGLLRFVQLAAGLAGAGAFAIDSTTYTGIVGGVIVAFVALDYSIDPKSKADNHKAQRRKYWELAYSREPLEEREKQLGNLQAEYGQNELETLRPVAFNDTLRELGYAPHEIRQYQEPEGVRSKIMRALA